MHAPRSAQVLSPNILSQPVSPVRLSGAAGSVVPLQAVGSRSGGPGGAAAAGSSVGAEPTPRDAGVTAGSAMDGTAAFAVGVAWLIGTVPEGAGTEAGVVRWAVGRDFFVTVLAFAKSFDAGLLLTVCSETEKKKVSGDQRSVS